MTMSLDAAKKELSEKGYFVLENVLTPAECDHFKRLLENDCKRYTPRYAGSTTKSEHRLEDTSVVKVVYNLHNKHIDYFKLFDHPKVLPLIEAMLKDGSYQNAESFHLLNTSARCPLPNVPAQQLHLDSNLPGGHYQLIMIALWMFDDFTPENGSTRVVPGSHTFMEYPATGKTYPEEVSVIAPRGSVLVYNGSLWHGNGLKTLPGDRWAAIFGYGRWFIKPSFDFMKNTPRAIYNQLTDAQKDLLGFRSNPPKDEFTRLRRRSADFEEPDEYQLPITE